MTSYVIVQCACGNFFAKTLGDFNILSVNNLKKNASIDFSYLDVKNCSSLDLSQLISLCFCFAFATTHFVLCGLPLYLVNGKRNLHITVACLGLGENTVLISSVRRLLFHLFTDCAISEYNT